MKYPNILSRTLVLVLLVCIAVGTSAMDLATAKAMAISAPRVEYPHEARAKGITGSGLYVMTVNEKGLVTVVTVASSSGHKILDREALVTLKRWRFRPGPTKVRMPVTWTL